jgi:hypothetical protein
MKMTAFWDIVPCIIVEVDRRFRGAYIIRAIMGAVRRVVSLKLDRRFRGAYYLFYRPYDGGNMHL